MMGRQRINREARESVGKMGEQFVARVLRRSFGLRVKIVAGNSDYDLLVCGVLRCEVKTALPSSRAYDPRRGNGQRWQFEFRDHGLPNNEDVVFLVCCDALGNPLRCHTFVIPGDHVEIDRRKIDITNDPDEYSGKWARWLNRWGVVASMRVAYDGPEQPALWKPRPSVEDIADEIPF